MFACKMFDFFKIRKSNTPERTIELVIDALGYEQLKKRALMEGVSENEELLRALRRGM
jgi:hypothetical protein